MSRTTDMMIDTANLEEAFSDLLKRLLRKHPDQIVHVEPHPGPGLSRDRADFILTRPSEGVRIAVEFKLYRGVTDHALLQNALSRLRANMTMSQSHEGILIVTSRLTPAMKHKWSDGTIRVWDADKLIALASGDAGLEAETLELLKAAQVGALPVDYQDGSDDDLGATGVIEVVAKGQALVRELEGLEAGHEHAGRFEEVCEEALKLLFRSGLTAWRRQSTIESGFQRMDLIARVLPGSAFWGALGSDFRSRYVVFEFKNYQAPIGQGEVFTTEKYLFTAALRSIAIVISRHGADRNASKAMLGALREQGKLILCIDQSQLIRILRGFDQGDDPNNLVADLLDDMLVSVAR